MPRHQYKRQARAKREAVREARAAVERQACAERERRASLSPIVTAARASTADTATARALRIALERAGVAL